MAELVSSDPVDTLLLVLPLRIFRREGRLFIDGQAANGLQQWLRHFKSLTLAVPLCLDVMPPATTVPFDGLEFGGRVEILPLPDATTPWAFIGAFWRTCRSLASLIDSHDYLHFAIGGFWGDWAALGALMAAKRGRKASVWTDRVEWEVMRGDAQRTKGARRLYRLVNALGARWLERRVIRRTPLGLFHGKDTFDVYQPFSPNPQLVHDIHLKKQDRISPHRLTTKIASASEGPLDIIYAGRVNPDKGVMDWIETLRHASEADISYRARWFGDGPQLQQARAKVESLGLADRIIFAGAVTDRVYLLEQMRDAHIMLFCHLTRESPRCLIESLVSGTPIVGYRRAYPEDLIAANGGGVLTPAEPIELAGKVVHLSNDRAALADLFSRAACDGHDMNDEAVFTHRAELMKRYT